MASGRYIRLASKTSATTYSAPPAQLLHRIVSSPASPPAKPLSSPSLRPHSRRRVTAVGPTPPVLLPASSSASSFSPPCVVAFSSSYADANNEQLRRNIVAITRCQSSCVELTRSKRPPQPTAVPPTPVWIPCPVDATAVAVWRMRKITREGYSG